MHACRHHHTPSALAVEVGHLRRGIAFAGDRDRRNCLLDPGERVGGKIEVERPERFVQPVAAR
jgi:hypothetical protein